MLTNGIHARIKRGGQWGPDPLPLENKKVIGFLSNIGPDPLKNHKATKPSFNVGPSTTRQRNTIKMAFRWWTDDDPLLVVKDPPIMVQQ